MIKHISMNTERVFIPEFDGNKNEPVSDQIKFHYKAITSSIKEDLIKPLVEMKRSSATGEMEQVISMAIDKRKVLEKLVTSIENLGYAVNESDAKKITTIAALFEVPIEVGFHPLIEEAFVFFQDLLNQKVDEKN